ncbi:MAG: PEP-utilizing enzyme, partial [Verrucomicrobiota bacterium]
MKHKTKMGESNRLMSKLEAQLPRRLRPVFTQHVELLRRYVPFHEDGKHYLMMGFDLLRDLALEAGQRLKLGDDIFYLTESEMLKALKGAPIEEGLIEQRKARWAIESRIDLPPILDGDDINALDEPKNFDNDEIIQGAPLSAGQNHGQIRIVQSWQEAVELPRGSILVDPGSDPGWTPQYINASGLIFRSGNALSSGAVVARELGIPALVIDDALDRFVEGELVTIDGREGWVQRRSPEQITLKKETVHFADSWDPEIPHEWEPPPMSRKENIQAGITVGMLAFWVVLFSLLKLIPGWNVFEAGVELFDWLFFPLVGSISSPAFVALLGCWLALFLVVIYRYLTDFRRLNVARERARRLKKERRSLRKGLPRYLTMTRLRKAVRVRSV